MQDLISYLDLQTIQHSEVDQIVTIDGKTYELIYPKEGKLFTGNFQLLVDEKTNCDNYIFNFGGEWYYTPKETEKHPQLNKVRYLGESNRTLPTPTFLGVRGTYEVLNGTGHYSEWMKKAKFLGVKSLGICEKNSLAGVLKFQNECLQNNIKPVIGATYTIYRSKEDYKYDIKCYVRNEEGWVNLLMINKEVNVINNKYIEEKRFFELTEGLIIVLDPKSLSWSKLPFYEMSGVDSYYQLDTVEYEQEDRDKEYLLNLKQYVKNNLRPISITDAFYLNKEDAFLKVKLNQISEIREFKSSNQYFKSKEEYFNECDLLFKNDERSFSYGVAAMNNEVDLVSRCDFQIVQGGKHLPVYEMTDEEKKLFKTNDDLFWDLILKGLQKKIPPSKHQQYIERVETEVEVIELGHFIDYFLILWDIIKWSNEHGILTGIGRGSAGGCLVAYLLDITRLDPIEFGLLFERFLNKGRVEGGSLPDIDCDFSGDRRDEVKHYMEQRYGVNQICSVGTYNTLKLKSAIKDLAKLYDLGIQETNYITSIIDDGFDGRFSGTEITLIFQSACKTKQVMSFVQNNPALINDLILILNLPKTQSIHACATIIFPKEKDVFHWVPVKNMLTKDKETCLVSEWEGAELESVGLLKEDILGIRQLDKFQFIIELIKKNRNIDLDIYDLEYDDEKIFKYFRKGWNQDVFHFGARGLTQYCKQSKPDNINDLIAAISLYRPGPIESNLHNEYILRKEGEKDIEYLWGTEEITKSTYGILIYQEQIMQTCVKVGGFSLVEADDIRKALGKMKTKYSDPYKVQFIEGAVTRGCDRAEAENIWLVMERFALYGFNASHAAAYTITGYICQYLKVYYPLEFWTSAFEYIDDQKREERVSQFVSEINRSGGIKISPPDINNSEIDVKSSFELNTIYWSLQSVKQVGEIAIEQIMLDREKKGKYFSFEEFLSRHTFPGSKVNKSTVENLIYAGAFDKVESIERSSGRKKLIEFYRDKKKVVVDKTKDLFTLGGNDLFKDFWWDLQQKRLSGVAFFDYQDIVDQYLTGDYKYIDQDQFQSKSLNDHKYYGTGGYIVEVTERESKKSGKYCSLKIESNFEFLWVTIFPEMYKILLASGLELVGSEGCLLILSGMIKFDDFKQENTMKVWENSELVILR